MQLQRLTRRLIHLRRVADHIDRHLDADLRLDQLADVAHLSRFHFERVFADYAGETPLARVRRLRMEQARRRLERGEADSLLQLALDCGYASSEAFSRAFRSQFGRPPSAWPRSEEPPEQSIRIETLPALPIQYLPYEGSPSDEMRAFDELRARALLQRIARERRRGWSVQLSDPSDSQRLKLRAALLSEPLGTRIPGLDLGTLPEGKYAVINLIGSFQLPHLATLAERVALQAGHTLREGPVLRSFHNAHYLPAAPEKRCTLYIPVSV